MEGQPLLDRSAERNQAFVRDGDVYGHRVAYCRLATIDPVERERLAGLEF